MFTLQIKPLFLIEGGVKSVIRGDCDCDFEWQGGKLSRLFVPITFKNSASGFRTRHVCEIEKFVHLSRKGVKSDRNAEIN